MTAYLIASGIWVFVCVLCPLAYYVGYFGMALICEGPNWFKVWRANRRVIKTADQVIQQWELTAVRKVYPA